MVNRVNPVGGRRGLLIVFCGIDGSGKSTQEELVARWMEAAGHSFVQTKQPTDFYRKNVFVQAYLKDGDDSIGMNGLALLAAADREVHMARLVRPTLARGHHVLCNRYVYSSIAYFSARGVDSDFVRLINRHVQVPDLTILTDISPSLARERVIARDGPTLKFEERELDFMKIVQQTFLKLANPSFLVLDGSLPAEKLHHQVIQRVSALLSPDDIG